MATPSIVDNPEHWRSRAEEMRRLAGDIRDDVAKQMMLQIAEDYERLAQRAEQRARHLSTG